MPVADEEYPQRGAHRYAGITSLGLSGTNVHVVLEEGVPVASAVAPMTRAPSPRAQAWSVSARNPEGLRGQAQQLHGWVAQHPEVGVESVARSLGVQRAHLEHRAVVLGRDRE